MRLIDADAFDTILENGEIEAKKQRKYVLASALNTVRGNLAKQSSVSSSNCSEIPNNWIPTSKERPPQHQEIWITDDLGTVELVYGKDGIWWLDDNYYTEPEIIAWMPANVPEPYKPEEEAE